MSEDYTKDGVLLLGAHAFSPKNGELLGVTAKDELRSGSLCLRRSYFEEECVGCVAIVPFYSIS